MLAMLGSRLTIIIVAVVALASYWKWSQTEIDSLKENNKTLSASLSVQKETIESLNNDIVQITNINKSINKKTKQYNVKLKKLEKKLEITKSNHKRDLEKIANRKPALLSKYINRGSNFRLRCLEIATGSPILESEKNLKKKDRNNLCPELFNYDE